jgi:hypothetical protein
VRVAAIFKETVVVSHAHVQVPPGVTIQMIRKADARASKLGIAPPYAEIRTLRPNGTYAYHWIVLARAKVAQVDSGGFVELTP